MKEGCLFHILLLLTFILFAKNELGNTDALVVENNPFYGLSKAKVKSVESTTNDNLINIKVEYSPRTIQPGSPEFFKGTLFYKNNNQSVLHADTDIMITKNGKELYKESTQFSQGYVHTPNGIVLSSYKFPGAGQYIISVKIMGINFIPIPPQTSKFCVQYNRVQLQLPSKYSKMNTSEIRYTRYKYYHLISLFSKEYDGR